MKRAWCGSRMGGCNPGNVRIQDGYSTNTIPCTKFDPDMSGVCRMTDASFIRSRLLQDTDNDGHERYLPKH
jgi:hypothetical protein